MTDKQSLLFCFLLFVLWLSIVYSIIGLVLIIIESPWFLIPQCIAIMLMMKLPYVLSSRYFEGQSNDVHNSR